MKVDRKKELKDALATNITNFFQEIRQGLAYTGKQNPSIEELNEQQMIKEI